MQVGVEGVCGRALGPVPEMQWPLGDGQEAETGQPPATGLQVLRYLAVAPAVSCKSVTRYPLKIKRRRRHGTNKHCPVRGCNEGISPPQVCSVLPSTHREAPPSLLPRHLSSAISPRILPTSRFGEAFGWTLCFLVNCVLVCCLCHWRLEHLSSPAAQTIPLVCSLFNCCSYTQNPATSPDSTRRQFCFCCWVSDITRTLLLAPLTGINSIICSSSCLILHDLLSNPLVFEHLQLHRRCHCRAT